MRERELRASIEIVGPLLPVLRYRDRVLDGSMRSAICAELGLVPRVEELHSLAQACAALWALHPERAVRLALEHTGGVREVAQLCGARVAEVAPFVHGKSAKAETRAPRHTRGQKKILLQVWVEPQLKHFLKAAGDEELLDLSAAVRVASWEYVQRILRRAPIEGGSRAPSIDEVRPAERRRAARYSKSAAAAK